MRTLLIGDTHGHEGFSRRVCRSATASNVQAMIQLGDFGFLFKRDFIRVWTDWLEEDDSRLFFWLDGNHDDHNYIEEEILGGRWHDLLDAGDPVIDHPIAHWHERMFYCPRGSVTKLGDTTVQFLGGAYSIDKHRRAPDVTWWHQETITMAQAGFAVDNSYGVEVMFTHDCPNTAWFQRKLRSGDYKVDRDSQNNRDMVTAVVQEVSPHTLYHGHYHYPYEAATTYDKGMTNVVGLSDSNDHPPVYGDNVRLIEL